MSEQYWLVHPNGGRQLIDPGEFDLSTLAERASRLGGRLIVENHVAAGRPNVGASDSTAKVYEPPLSALKLLFRRRLATIHDCQVEFELEVHGRPTHRVLGGYYKSKRLVRVYAVDRDLGRRSIDELFDTFLHEVAHHLEYTEPENFRAIKCERVPGRMHSRLFWRILGELKGRWVEASQRHV